MNDKTDLNRDTIPAIIEDSIALSITSAIYELRTLCLIYNKNPKEILTEVKEILERNEDDFLDDQRVYSDYHMTNLFEWRLASLPFLGFLNLSRGDCPHCFTASGVKRKLKSVFAHHGYKSFLNENFLDGLTGSRIKNEEVWKTDPNIKNKEVWETFSSNINHTTEKVITQHINYIKRKPTKILFEDQKPEPKRGYYSKSRTHNKL